MKTSYRFDAWVNDELNEVKLKNYLDCDFLDPAEDTKARELLGRFWLLGPVGVAKDIKIVADLDVDGMGRMLP